MSAETKVGRRDLLEHHYREGAELHEERERLDRSDARFWERYERWQAEGRELGVQSDFLLGPMAEACYGGWRQHGARDNRLALTQIAEAPVGEEPS